MEGQARMVAKEGTWGALILSSKERFREIETDKKKERKKNEKSRKVNKSGKK